MMAAPDQSNIRMLLRQRRHLRHRLRRHHIIGA
jgi:hypothetical protein